MKDGKGSNAMYGEIRKITFKDNATGITIPICKLFLAARKERNTHIAHNGGTITMNIENVKTIFNEIIKKIPW